jgi:hypothetical protein
VADPTEVNLLHAIVCLQVTCGSVIKVQHSATGALLHSHDITYGSGSGQQSVTGFSGGDDASSYWIVRGTEVLHVVVCSKWTPRTQFQMSRHCAPAHASNRFLALGMLTSRDPRYRGSIAHKAVQSSLGPRSGCST